MKKLIVVLLVLVLLLSSCRRHHSLSPDDIYDSMIVIWSYIEGEGEYTREEAREAYKVIEQGYDEYVK